jgi:hypothetical protein
VVGFSGARCLLKRRDGAQVVLAVAPHPAALHEMVRAGQWDAATRLCRCAARRAPSAAAPGPRAPPRAGTQAPTCAPRACRFAKERCLWACLAALAMAAKELGTAEAGFAALGELDKLRFVKKVRAPGGRAGGRAELGVCAARGALPCPALPASTPARAPAPKAPQRPDRRPAGQGHPQRGGPRRGACAVPPPAGRGGGAAAGRGPDLPRGQAQRAAVQVAARAGAGGAAGRRRARGHGAVVPQQVGAGRWALGSGLSGLWALGSGLWALGAGRWALGAGRWALGAGRWALGSGLWALGAGLWALGSGLWALGSGLWALGWAARAPPAAGRATRGMGPLSSARRRAPCRYLRSAGQQEQLAAFQQHRARYAELDGAAVKALARAEKAQEAARAAAAGGRGLLR